MARYLDTLKHEAAMNEWENDVRAIEELEREEERFLHDLAMNPQKRRTIADPMTRQLAEEYARDLKLKNTRLRFMILKQGNKRFTNYEDLAYAYSLPRPGSNVLSMVVIARRWNDDPRSMNQKIRKVRVDYIDSSDRLVEKGTEVSV